ncbi:superoxide dismutase 1 copper chaperone [Paracoccidioides lutzii Pb01]|uniref:Superoxide dismutase 1 copper chaperone n=1 Tax=Paracoccidioides lutzii (strain ATCC MYA-826 / Pb01) TaxID=502779 RepID=C1H6W0_PARBA|nr:superoxide dismutase 1 copper chaperone [Paracoccidioides lutzii Pb01]EEH35454.2 superoxide dismutase 1 copper chaperone [Paracoccidioides lutzii Pb01]
MIEPFQAIFSVPLSCEACIEDVSKSLHALDGIKSVQGNLKDQILVVEGTAAPSAIVSAIQNTGRDAILRGCGTSNSQFLPLFLISLHICIIPNFGEITAHHLSLYIFVGQDASVCILETHASTVKTSIRGLARMVQVAPKLTLVDLTINGLDPGNYWATVREKGDISQGAASTGNIWESLKQNLEGSESSRGVFGQVEVDSNGKGNVFLDRPVAVWELIGRSMVVSASKEGPFRKEDPNTLVGVIARSAGIWDNNKMNVWVWILILDEWCRRNQAVSPVKGLKGFRELGEMMIQMAV